MFEDFEESSEVAHQTQPLVLDEKGIVRFKENKIILSLYNKGLIDFNKIYAENFSSEDMRQLVQLIGYTLDGYYELPYVDQDNCVALEYEERKLILQKGE